MSDFPNSPNYLINSLDRGLAVLNHFIQQPEMSFTDFMKVSGLSKAATKRILYTLEHNQFVKYNPKRKTYYLGIRMFELGTVAGENLALLKVSKPYMESVYNQINETIFVVQKVEIEQVYLHRIERSGTVPLKTPIGYRRPLYFGLGKTILAYMSDNDINRCLPEIIPPYSMRTLPDRESFIKEIQDVRNQGFGIDSEEYSEGIIGIGFPIFLSKVKIFGLIGVVGPPVRMTCEKKDLVISLLRKVSKAISMELDQYIYANE